MARRDARTRDDVERVAQCLTSRRTRRANRSLCAVRVMRAKPDDRCGARRVGGEGVGFSVPGKGLLSGSKNVTRRPLSPPLLGQVLLFSFLLGS